MRLILLLLLGFGISIAEAAIEAYEFDSPQMEADYNQLINELRCLVCQNQNLSGSDADLAKDLRRETYEMLQQGKSSRLFASCSMAGQDRQVLSVRWMYGKKKSRQRCRKHRSALRPLPPTKTP